MSECLEENEIVDFVMRNLEPEDAARAEAHIDTCPACRAVLIELARVFELRASSLPEPTEESHDVTEQSGPESLGLLPPELLKGSNVGRYMMLELLGTGAMGVVFAAYDPELDRKVAVKLLRDRSGDAERNARMVREARATARLAHPNVVVVHDVGEFEGNVFMAMELVTGGTLGGWLEAESRRRDEILDAFIEAGEGLAAAHEAGLVHRDFKPANVLMGENGRPRVTDFGLARAGESAETTQETMSTISGSLDVAVTKTGALVGTPAYMSPEQFEGRVADARSDQFSYCVALAEALCGERPFEGSSLLELQGNVCAGRLRPHVFEELPRSLQGALRRGLQRDPAERHGDMATLLKLLGGVRKRSPAKTWTRLGALSVAVVGGAGVAWAGNEARVDPPTFESCQSDAQGVDDLWTPERRRELEASLASIERPAAPRIARSVVMTLDAYAQAWTDAHASTCETEDALGVQFAQLRCLERGEAELGALLVALGEGDSAVLEYAEEAVRDLPQPQSCATPGWLDNSPVEPPEAIGEQVDTQQHELGIADAYLATGQYSLAAAKAGQVLAAARELDYAPLRLEALLVQAAALNLHGKFDDAVALLRTGWADAIRVNDPRAQVRIAATMVDIIGNELRELEDGQFWIEVAEAALARLDPSDPAAWDFWNSAGKFKAYAGEYDVALEYLDRAESVPGVRLRKRITTKHARLAVVGLHAKAEEQERLLEENRAVEAEVREAFGERHPRLVRVIQGRANTLTLLGRGEEAVAALDEAMDIAGEVFAADDPRLDGVLTSRASARHALGDVEGARDDFAKVLELRQAVKNDGMGLGLAYNNLATAEISLGEFDAAVDHLEKALPLMEKGFGSEHINVANMHTSMSSSLIALERYDEARTHLATARSIAEKVGPTAARLNPVIALNTARAEMGAGDYEAAASVLEEGLALAEDAYGATHPIMAKFLSTHAKVLVAQGKPTKALAVTKRGLEVATDSRTQGVLKLTEAAAHALGGDAAACVTARDEGRVFEPSSTDDPCAKERVAAGRRGAP